MTWNCRIIRSFNDFGEDFYAIHEVFYDNEGKPQAWTESPVEVTGNAVEEIRGDLEQKWEALDMPVLELVPHPGGEGETLITVEEEEDAGD